MNDKPVAAGKSSFDLIDTEKAFALMALMPGSKFLDLACGIGRYSMEVARKIGEKGTVYAVDLWCEGIEALEREIDHRRIKNITTICADMRRNLPFADNSIDACLVATILHDLATEDRRATVREINRLLRPGGMLHVIEFKKIEKGPGPPVTIRMDEGDVETLVTQYGFTKIAGSEVGEFNYMVKYQKASL